MLEVTLQTFRLPENATNAIEIEVLMLLQRSQNSLYSAAIAVADGSQFKTIH